jgi:hypothetical protein
LKAIPTRLARWHIRLILLVWSSSDATVKLWDGATGAIVRVSTDYVYVMQFDGDKISGMTKVWHSGLAVKALGWP